MKRCQVYAAAGWVLCVLLSGARAADPLEGASNVLAQVASIGQAPAVANPKELALRRLTDDLAGFAKERNALPPERAAAAWLALFDRLWKVDARDLQEMNFGEDESGEGPLSFQRLFAEIPGPAAWPEIQKLAAGREPSKGADGVKDCALQLYAAYLNGDTKAIDDLLAKSDSLLPGGEKYQRDQIVNAVKEIKMMVENARSVNSPEDVIRHYRKMLEESAKAAGPRGGGEQIQIPDLVSLAGAAEAEKLLLLTLALPVSLQVPSGGQTKALLKKVVLANAAQLKMPQWQLVDSLEDVGLYEAMAARFPAVSKTEANAAASAIFSAASALFGSNMGRMAEVEDYRSAQTKPNATLCYIVGLVAAGRSAEAVSNAVAMKAGDVGDYLGAVLQKVDRPSVAEALFDFAGKVMKEDGPRIFQSMYCSLALSLGHTNELFSRLEARVADPKSDEATRRAAQWLLIEAYLAEDAADKAVSMLRGIALAVGKEEEPAGEGAESTKAATLLVQLGDALGRPELIDEGLKALVSATEKSSGQSPFIPSSISFGSHSFSESLDDLLIRNGKTAALERMIKASMRVQIRQLEKMRQDGGYGRGALGGDLARLVDLYGRLGRHQDVLYLACNAVWWSVGDLAEMMSDYDNGTAAVRIAAALAASGSASNATAILKAHLYNRQGDDKAYSVLAGIEGAALIPWLDALYARDRFEERPLIWKAELLRKAGKLDEAENVVREALKVDPTDGEQPPGDRVRAYAVLGDVLADKGKKEDAAFFRNVVKSVRVAEDGDRLSAIGLTKRSIKVYEEAEVAFADAYCVQWRLAERLHAMGKFEEAEKHYQIAFERMPEQFGQVANFCFGCEGVFAKEHSRSVAERVLGKLVQTHADRAQVHFMMGQLREAQGRETEAYQCFKKAVEIDPGYLDAWAKMSALSRILLLPQSQRDAIALRGLELDPLGRHFSANAHEVQDLKALWLVMEKNQKYMVEPPAALFVLEASRKAIDAERKQQGGRAYSRGWSQSARLKPGQMIVSQRVASTIMQLVNSASYARMSMSMGGGAFPDDGF